jgi:hypothetical protein
LDKFTGSGSEAAQADASRFVISIHLGSDVEHYDKSIEVGVEDAPPDNVVVIPTAKKSKKKLLKVDDGE